MTWLPRAEWLRTPCPVPLHDHNGPTDQCRKVMRAIEALGPDGGQCFRCGTPCVKLTTCEMCGHDPRPPVIPKVMLAGRDPGKYEDDGVGCVERVSMVERG